MTCAHRWVIPSEVATAVGTCRLCGAQKEFDNRPRVTDARGRPIGWTFPWMDNLEVRDA